MALLRQTLPLFHQSFSRNIKIVLQLPAIRQIYSATTLGVDNFLQHRDRIRAQLSNIAPNFREKMKEYTSPESNNMVFTEDLKNMLHLSESDEDVEITIKMMKKFNQQNKQLRFGNYIFGPVIMRMFHVLNKHEEAYQCFKSPELNGLFDQLITYQLLLDLLYENRRYDDILDAFQIIKDKQIEGIKFAKNVIVLVLGACYKINTPEILDYALKLWSELQSVGHLPMRRATTFCAALAINQGKPEVAIEILSTTKNSNYTTVRNIKVSALADLGRVEEAIIMLKNVLYQDGAIAGPVQTFNKEIIEKVKDAVVKRNDDVLTLEFNRIEKYFNEQGHICLNTLDEQLCQEISAPPMNRNNQDDNFRSQRFPRKQNWDNNQPMRRRSENYAPRRPGLVDLN
ncbi:hypothetical protein FQA39_LY13610 [Lamprigera yunnana]|nr:hypothetical protein FQA39_LY13610 [Lamprigera yunnana]